MGVSWQGGEGERLAGRVNGAIDFADDLLDGMGAVVLFVVAEVIANAVLGVLGMVLVPVLGIAWLIYRHGQRRQATARLQQRIAAAELEGAIWTDNPDWTESLWLDGRLIAVRHR